MGGQALERDPSGGDGTYGPAAGEARQEGLGSYGTKGYLTV